MRGSIDPVIGRIRKLPGRAGSDALSTILFRRPNRIGLFRRAEKGALPVMRVEAIFRVRNATARASDQSIVRLSDASANVYLSTDPVVPQQASALSQASHSGGTSVPGC
ncbi:hypothetical protein GCM10007887_10420 [Methylobacterium haplocladii]|uniref:Uncharacterized protein n=1 Tax=Methylobacterium haplocladii TaxID=1176176 RepID=A0A512IN31_9HYPH|nr:hypothetical protein MHA02_14890 [Methylobacterium haplocladii]GLS58382.1 hypothetical protein GCM10007887_10420 [Methylobacterium haplocladii]